MPTFATDFGVLAGKLGKPELARIWFRAALAIQPNHVSANAALNEAEASPPGS